MLFLFISCCFYSFLAIPVKIENARLILALTISTVPPITVANDAIEMLRFVTDKTMTYQHSQNKQCIYYVFFSLILFL